MRKIKSGDGATDFGASSGLTQEELLGRPALEYDRLNPLPDSPIWSDPAGESGWGVGEIPKKVQLNQQRIAELIHIELVKDEVSQGKIRSIGFMPSWISQAAGVIVSEYQ